MSEDVTMLTYIRKTPEVVLKNIEDRKSITKQLVDEYVNGGYKGITFVACGSSYNSCVTARYFLRKYLKAEVKVVTPFTFIHHEHDYRDGMLTVNVSQSGCSTNIIDCVLFEKHLGEKTISLVGRKDCDVKKYSDLLIDWCVGEEKIGYATIGVVTLVGYLMLFALEVSLIKGYIDEDEYDKTLSEMRKALEIHSQVVDETIEKYNENKEKITSCNCVYLVSSGANLGTAIEGSLKMAETNCIPCLAYEVEEYLHGPLYPVNPNTLLIFIDNNEDESSKKIIDIAKRSEIATDKVIAVTNSDIISDDKAIRTNSETDHLVSPLYKLAIVETLAYLRSEDTNKYKPDERMLEFKRQNKNLTKSRSDLYKDLQGKNI